MFCGVDPSGHGCGWFVNCKVALTPESTPHLPLSTPSTGLYKPGSAPWRVPAPSARPLPDRSQPHGNRIKILLWSFLPNTTILLFSLVSVCELRGCGPPRDHESCAEGPSCAPICEADSLSVSFKMWTHSTNSNVTLKHSYLKAILYLKCLCGIKGFSNVIFLFYYSVIFCITFSYLYILL